MAENRVEANAHNAGGCPASNAIHGHINDFLVRTGLRSGVSELQVDRVINQRLMPLHNKLFVEPNPIPVKWACKELGLVATDTLRLPMTPITDSGRETVRAALKHAGLL
ncbi:hypothetical protein ESCO111120_07850 [Escherichia coli]